MKQRRIQDLQGILQCVQAATDHEQMRACRPHRPGNSGRPGAT
jgi:hypothetical protein